MKEIGSVGKSTSALFTYNLATDEYLSTLKWPYDIEIYNKMERSDAQVKAMLLLLELPIRSTSWFVKPKDASSKAKEIALFVEDALFTGPPTGMKTTFDELIKNACTMFTYGHSVLEKVYEAKNGYVKWQKFAVRPQSTLYDWIYDDVGDLTAIQQWNLSKGWQIVEIPLDKLLIFTHDSNKEIVGVVVY